MIEQFNNMDNPKLCNCELTTNNTDNLSHFQIHRYNYYYYYKANAVFSDTVTINCTYNKKDNSIGTAVSTF